jgi:hypothetical protein
VYVPVTGRKCEADIKLISQILSRSNTIPA